MKYRKTEACRVVYGFGGHLQDDLEKYQGFMEVATEQGWRVVVLYERFESQLRKLMEADAVDAVVADFISEQWLESLPGRVKAVHVGVRPLSERVSSVSFDMRRIGSMAGRHLLEMGYEEFGVFSPLIFSELRAGVADGVGNGPVHWLRTLPMLRGRFGLNAAQGIFCLTDFHARQGIQLAKHLGVQIPKQAGFLGTGDRFWDGVVAETGISSLQLSYREYGRAAARALLDRLRGGAPRHFLLPPGRVLVRESSRRTDTDRLRLLADRLFSGQLVDPPSMEEVARQAGMSRRSFETAFSKETGTTPYDYLLGLREREAKRLLETTDWTVARIGARVGYPDPPRFSAFFRRRTGAPPGAWRNFSSAGEE